MSQSIVVETIFGRHHRYEVRKSPGGLLTSPSYSIWRDGQYWRGGFDSLKRAVEVARAAG